MNDNYDAIRKQKRTEKEQQKIYTCTIYSRTLVFILYHLNRLRSNQNHTRCTQIDVQPTKTDIKTRKKDDGKSAL